jgi:4-aminobutyrate aminotransferase
MIKIKTKIPGKRSEKILKELKIVNGGWSVPYPYVHSGVGKGAYFKDIDGNVFLDFASQIASNPLGYGNLELGKVIKRYSSHPVKFAGQDFCVEEHLDLINELIKISPSKLNAAFLVNSGAEAVENSIKICMRKRRKAKFSVSVNGAFHGRTLGALSLHHSKKLHRDGYFLEPNKKLPFSDEAGDKLKDIIKKKGFEKVAFVILEHFQGEGGYRMPSNKMVRDLRSICRENRIPYIADEVQAGMGRTGKWWAFEHYGIEPDVFSSAKALQVGAVVANKKMFPNKAGAISSTWGGGHRLDLAIGIKTIEIIRKKKMLYRNSKLGNYIMKNLNEIKGVSNVRGRGLMIAFDLKNQKMRDNFIIECIRKGLIVLGAGDRSIRVIPPFVVEERDIDAGLRVIKEAVRNCSDKGFRHKGHICDFMGCGITAS